MCEICHQHINVNSGQVLYEFKHLLNKLKVRDIIRYEKLKGVKSPKLHSLFKLIPGDIEDWERVKWEIFNR